MIVQEQYIKNPSYLRYYSSRGYYLQQDSILYQEILAVELQTNIIETTIPIPETNMSPNNIYGGENMTEQQAAQARKILLKAARVLPMEEALTIHYIFPEWQVGQDYTELEYIKYQGVLYQVRHDCRANSNEPPTTSPNYYRVPVPMSMALAWETGRSYAQNERVTYNGFVYESTINDNIWSPADNFGWRQIN